MARRSYGESEETEVAEPEVVDTSVAVANAKAAVAKAQADLVAAEKVHAAAAVSELDKAEKHKHILVDFGGTGDYVTRDLPDEWAQEKAYPRSLVVDGYNVEQVGEHNGVRKYRKM